MMRLLHSRWNCLQAALQTKLQVRLWRFYVRYHKLDEFRDQSNKLQKLWFDHLPTSPITLPAKAKAAALTYS